MVNDLMNRKAKKEIFRVIAVYVRCQRRKIKSHSTKITTRTRQLSSTISAGTQKRRTKYSCENMMT